MALVPGTRLGAYEIVGPIGAGGMGEVYRARDTRLGRTVAVKVLPTELATDAALRQRFEREARVVSSFQHPHICALFDVGEGSVGSETVRFLVLEFLDGETLAERLARAGALPLVDALRIAAEICDALRTAHRSGVVHRDLKPANVFLARQGAGSAPPVAKLLDFGLARTTPPVVAGSSLSMVPTTPLGATAQGTILGTFQYMAPEQIEGQEADARSDIFAFGAVLFEMLTGRPAFEGKTRAMLLGAILKDDPPAVSSLQRSAPPALDRIVSTCLAKDREDRWQTARDLLRELRWISTSAGTRPPAVAGGAARRTVLAALPIAIVAALLGAAAVRWITAGVTESSAPFRAVVPLEQNRLAGEASPLVLSRDGARLIYAGVRPDAATSQLFLHSFHTGETWPIPGTDGAGSAFFAPDDERIAFFAGTRLWTTSLSGAPPTPLCDAPLGVGGTWADDDTIYFAPSVSSGLWKVSARGGPCETVTTPEGSELSHRVPHLLPGGEALIYTVRGGGGGDGTIPEALRVLTLATGESHEIIPAGTSGRYVRSGHVVYARAGTLLAVPFDLASLQPVGPAVALQEVVNHGFEAAQFDVSDAGTLVYVRGQPDSARRRLVWVDENGTIQPVPGPPGAYYNPRISSDRGYAAVNLHDGSSRIYDLSTGVLHDLPLSAAFAIWTPNDSHVIFSLGLGRGLFRIGAFRREEPEVLVPAARGAPGSVTPDGAWLVYHGIDQATGDIDIWRVSLTGPSEPQRVVRTADRDVGARLSGNGELLAYVRDSATRHVYVTPFAGGGESPRVSVDGGQEPVWSRVGSTLFYRWRDRMMSVTIHTQPSLRADPPQEVFRGAFERGRAGLAGYDIASDGRFLMIEATAAEEVHVARNWVNGLTERLATRR